MTTQNQVNYMNMKNPFIQMLSKTYHEGMADLKILCHNNITQMAWLGAVDIILAILLLIFILSNPSIDTAKIGFFAVPTLIQFECFSFNRKKWVRNNVTFDKTKELLRWETHKSANPNEEFILNVIMEQNAINAKIKISINFFKHDFLINLVFTAFLFIITIYTF